MGQIILQLNDKSMNRLKNLTIHRSEEEVQSMVQLWFDWICELPQGFSIDLDTQLENWLDNNHYENGYYIIKK